MAFLTPNVLTLGYFIEPTDTKVFAKNSSHEGFKSSESLEVWSKWQDLLPQIWSGIKCTFSESHIKQLQSWHAVFFFPQGFPGKDCTRQCLLNTLYVLGLRVSTLHGLIILLYHHRLSIEIQWDFLWRNPSNLGGAWLWEADRLGVHPRSLSSCWGNKL